MDTHRLVAFAGVAFLFIITPGVDIALITRNALRHGGRAALHTALGIATGVAIWVLAAAVGLAGLVHTSAVAFAAIKLAGAAYLCILGAQSLWGSFRRSDGAAAADDDADEAAGAPTRVPLPSGRAYRQGILSNLLNPKTAIFYTSFLPQFVNPAHAALPQLLLLGCVHLGLSLVVMPCYALVAGRAAATLRRPRIKALLDRVTGGVLIAVGVRLATERR